jgi:hypothetical protein
MRDMGNSGDSTHNYCELSVPEAPQVGNIHGKRIFGAGLDGGLLSHAPTGLYIPYFLPNPVERLLQRRKCLHKEGIELRPAAVFNDLATQIA